MDRHRVSRFAFIVSTTLAVGCIGDGDPIDVSEEGLSVDGPPPSPASRACDEGSAECRYSIKDLEISKGMALRPAPRLPGPPPGPPAGCAGESTASDTRAEPAGTSAPP